MVSASAGHVPVTPLSTGCCLLAAGEGALGGVPPLPSCGQGVCRPGHHFWDCLHCRGGWGFWRTASLASGENGSFLRGGHGAIWTDVINPREVISYVRKVVSLKRNTLKMSAK